MGQAQINVRTRACSRTSIARTKQAALTHNVRGKELSYGEFKMHEIKLRVKVNATAEASTSSGQSNILR